MNVSSVKNLNGESFSAVQDAALTDFVSSNSASWTGEGTAGVSGTNVIFVPHYDGADNGNFYSATISGDVVVTTGHYYSNGADISPGREYSLSSIGVSIGNKLDKNIIENSNTIKIIDDRAEVTDKALRPVGFSDMSATYVDIREYRVDIEFNSQYVGIDSRLVSAIVTVETTASGSYIPDSWSLISYENNSAIFTKSYPLNERVGNFQLNAGYGGWGDFTNAEGSATVYSALELATLAFKDEITGGGATYSAGANIDITDNVISGKDWSSDINAATSGLQPSGDYLTAVPAGTMNESAFEYNANNKISGYNGSAFAGGSDVPEGVMVESGLEYNAVNEISGYNGSAIAQYGAEKQWLVHDDTLVHAANSAQYALGVNLSAVAQLLGLDETVLWSGTSAGTILSAETTLAESMKNFERIRFYFGSDYNQGQVIEQNCPVGSNNYFNFAIPGGGANCWMQYSKWSADGDFIKIKMQYCKAINYGSFAGTGTVTLTATTANDLTKVQKIVGIGRKQ